MKDMEKNNDTPQGSNEGAKEEREIKVIDKLQ